MKSFFPLMIKRMEESLEVDGNHLKKIIFKSKVGIENFHSSTVK